MSNSSRVPFFITIPHSGENIPKEVTWLSSLSEAHLMRDVDRFVDKLYRPVIDELHLPCVVSPWHRYVIDLNRSPNEFDADSVEGAAEPSGRHPKGLHWSITTLEEPLLRKPMSMDLHQTLLKEYYWPFHNSVQELGESLVQSAGQVFHLDAHSMPSLGTNLHPDPGQQRADIVVSDFHGSSCRPEFKEIVMEAYQRAGFEVAYNWPYVGGGITKKFGRPSENFHTLQVELNRKLYMDEKNKSQIHPGFEETQAKISTAVTSIYQALEKWIGIGG
ncbi:MAG: N-formylglutamate amidohydrolase [Bdellovibrionales bacterium]|nr:N-formylglutamate amidohydrolase [Bdellovibrionales bacterium]